jgi:hypothetical protein
MDFRRLDEGREEETMAVHRASAGEAYRQRLFTLLGERNPLEVMAQTATSLGGIVRTTSPAILRSCPRPGKWTPNEIIGHLTDGEWVYGYRLRLILSEDGPMIIGSNQDRWVAAQRYDDRDPAEMVEMFATMRRFNLDLSKQLSDVELKRSGQHNERGPESLEVMLRLVAGHDLSHLDQIHRYIEAVERAEN